MSTFARPRLPTVAQWYSVFIGPIVWVFHFAFSYLVSEKTCDLGPSGPTIWGLNEAKAIAGLATLIGAVLLIIGLAIALRWWRHSVAPVDGPPPTGRNAFLARLAAGSCLMFLLLVLTEGIPNLLILRVCS